MRNHLGRAVEALLAAYLVFALVLPPRFGSSWFVGEALAQSSPAPGTLLPGFGGASATPRMLVIMDTSKSMRFYPDNTGQSNADFTPNTGAAHDDTLTQAEGSALTVTCGLGRISQVLAAVYGRTIENNLPASLLTPHDNHSSCDPGSSMLQDGLQRGWLDVTPAVERACLNKGSCSLPVDSIWLGGNPCAGPGGTPGPAKDLWVRVTCDVDPCPPSAGSKFCLAKKALYTAVQSQLATGLVDIAAGGYAQFDYYQHHDAVNSNYDTECRYDIVLPAGGFTSDLAGPSAIELDLGNRAPNPSNGSDANLVTWPCNPEAEVVFNSLLPKNGNIYNGGGALTGCAAQTAKTCSKYWSRGGTSKTLYQNPNPACKTSVPSGGNPWVWDPGCQPPDDSADRAFVNTSAGSKWVDPPDLLVPSTDFLGTCANAPDWYTDVTVARSGASVGGGVPPNTGLPLGAAPPRSCNTPTGCAYQLTSPTGSPSSIRSTYVYNSSFGIASLATPVTIGALTYNAGYDKAPLATPETVVLPVAALGGSCPAPGPAVTYTGPVASTIAWANSPTPPYRGSFRVSDFNPSANWGEDCSVARNGAQGCQLTGLSATPTTLYTCPNPGYTGDLSPLPTSNPALQCTQTTYMHETTGVVGAPASPGVYSAWVGHPTAGSWQSFDYSVDLVTYGTALAAGTDLCGSPATIVTWTGSSYPAAGPGITPSRVPCGASNDPANGGASPTSGGTSVCNIKQGAPTELRTDEGVAKCHGAYYAEPYTRTATPGSASACSLQVSKYTYNYNQDFCKYRRFSFKWDQVQFSYRWTSNSGDYGGSFDQRASYPDPVVPVGKEYCDVGSHRDPGVDPDEPYAESNSSNGGGFSYRGFVMPSPQAGCPAQLAAGTGSCPANAKYCKLRWSSDTTPGNRFQKVQPATGAFSVGSTPASLQPGVDDRRGCELGDPGPHDKAVRSVLHNWSDWCATPRHDGYTPASYDSVPKRMADFYTPNAAFTNANHAAWPALWNSANPFTSPLDKFCAVDETGAQVCTTSFPSGPFPTNKSSGLSLEPTTLAGGSTSATNTDFNLGMTFNRWKRSKSCTGDTDCASISGSTCAAHACTDPTWASRALALFSAYDSSTNPWGLHLPDQGDITPLTGSLTNALAYITKTRSEDSQSTCRRYSVMLVTDGYEEPSSFGGVANDPVAAVTALRAAGVDVYVVGFGIKGGVLDQMAQAAGTAVDAAGNASATGGAYDASDFAALQKAISNIIGAQLNGTFSRSKPTLTSSGDRLYSAYFGVASARPFEFFGYVDAFPVSAGAVGATPAWKFDQVLNTVTTEGSRTMYTRVRGSGSLANFDEGPVCDLAKDMCSKAVPHCSCMCGPACSSDDAAYVDSIIHFVRNDRSGSSAGKYDNSAVRQTRIADVFYSQPVPVPPPNQSPLYASLSAISVPNNDNSPRVDSAASPGFDMVKFNHAYDQFKTVHEGRELQVLVHSNDGVLHSIRESMAATAPSWLGEERWGYVPRQTQPLLYTRLGGHRFLADGSFAEADVCFGQTDCEKADGSGWKSLLVGALGRGGPYLYGLDITDPDAPKWAFDVNPDSTDFPNNLREKGFGLATSAPVLARVKIGSDPYIFGAFVGGGAYDSDRGSANNDCLDSPGEQENGNYFYVLDANPAHVDVHTRSADPLTQGPPAATARWCIPGVNQVNIHGHHHHHEIDDVIPNNAVPGRPGVLRQNGNSRASTVYFGDTDGKLNRMDVTSTDLRNWAPQVWFNPYDQNVAELGHFTAGAHPDSLPGASCTLSGGKVWPMPNIGGSPPNRDIPLEEPDNTEGLAPIWQRPYRYTNQNTSRDVLYVGTGDPTNPNSSSTNRQNYFYAVEDQTGVSTDCPALLRWSYYLEDGAKVLSDPVAVGNNLVVGVYMPPGGSGGCGSAGYSLLFCFDRLSGSPTFCLANNSTPSVHDDPAPVSGNSRWLEVGSGMVSDLTAVGNSVVFTTSTNPGSPTQKSVQNVNVPFKVRSWRRLR